MNCFLLYCIETLQRDHEKSRAFNKQTVGEPEGLTGSLQERPVSPAVEVWTQLSI